MSGFPKLQVSTSVGAGASARHGVRAARKSLVARGRRYEGVRQIETDCARGDIDETRRTSSCAKLGRRRIGRRSAFSAQPRPLVLGNSVRTSGCRLRLGPGLGPSGGPFTSTTVVSCAGSTNVLTATNQEVAGSSPAGPAKVLEQQALPSKNNLSRQRPRSCYGPSGCVSC